MEGNFSRNSTVSISTIMGAQEQLKLPSPYTKQHHIEEANRKGHSRYLSQPHHSAINQSQASFPMTNRSNINLRETPFTPPNQLALGSARHPTHSMNGVKPISKNSLAPR